MSLLEIRDLHICLPEGSERAHAVEAVDLERVDQGDGREGAPALPAVVALPHAA